MKQLLQYELSNGHIFQVISVFFASYMVLELTYIKNLKIMLFYGCNTLVG